jgi:hypothetical protein
MTHSLAKPLDPQAVVPLVGHIFVPTIIQMTDYILGGEEAAPGISRERGDGARGGEGLRRGAAAMVRKDG